MSRVFVNVWFPQPTVLLIFYFILFVLIMKPSFYPPGPPKQHVLCATVASKTPNCPVSSRFLSSAVDGQKAAFLFFFFNLFSFFLITCVTCLLLLTADTTKWVAKKKTKKQLFLEQSLRDVVPLSVSFCSRASSLVRCFLSSFIKSKQQQQQQQQLSLTAVLAWEDLFSSHAN